MSSESYLTRRQLATVGAQIAAAQQYAEGAGAEPKDCMVQANLEVITKLFNELLDAKRLAYLLWKRPAVFTSTVGDLRQRHLEHLSADPRAAAQDWVLDNRAEALDLLDLLTALVNDPLVEVPR